MKPEKKALFAQKLHFIQSKLTGETKLLLVSKTRSIEEIQLYYDLGQRDFGENRVQELSEKAEALRVTCPEIRWHMIGHLQSNKLNQLFSIPHLYAVHSVDDLDLICKMLKAEQRLSHHVGLFLQYNTSMEEQKSGFESYESLKTAAQSIPDHSKLKVIGLMTMGTLRTVDFEAEALRCFKDLNTLKKRLSEDLGRKLETSMGMSQDYHIALLEHSNWIRLGTMMFQ